MSFGVSEPSSAADEGGLRGRAGRVHRRGRVGQDQQVAAARRRGRASRSQSPAGAGRRELQQEVAVVAAAVRDHDHVRRPARASSTTTSKSRVGVYSWAVNSTLGRVRGLLDRGPGASATSTLLQRQRRVDRHVDRQLAQRVLLQQLALQGVAVAVAVALERQHLRVGDLDPLLGVRRDREDAGLEDVAAGPFEQARVALLAQDRLVDLAGPLLLDDVGLDQLVADPHAEAGDRRVLRQREVEHAFELAGRCG